MMKLLILKRALAVFLCLIMLISGLPVCAETEREEAATGNSSNTLPEETLGLECKSACLMEASTGKILYADHAEEPLPPASVTKIMTLLLIMEAIEAGTLRLQDQITASETAASMGGSQIFLKVGEAMSAEDLLKSVVIASANDAAVAFAEHISGSVETFVARMNQRAAELGMEHTHFENVTGLDDAVINHTISAKDIAIMSRELISHPKILEYSSIWMDTIRDGTFGLTNTNRLVRFYNGCTGLKTGSTAKAGFCVSATATRDGMTLIAVIMGAPNRDARNRAAARLLDWGFAQYGVYEVKRTELVPLRVTGGNVDLCRVAYENASVVLPKNVLSDVVTEIEIPEVLSAPVKEGDRIGVIRFSVKGAPVLEIPVRSLENVERIGYLELLRRMIAKYLLI